MNDRNLFTLNVMVEEILIRGEGDARTVLVRQEQIANIMVSADRDKVVAKADLLTAYAFDLEGIETLIEFVGTARGIVAARGDTLLRLRREGESDRVIDEARADFNEDAYEVLERVIEKLNLAGNETFAGTSGNRIYER